MDIQRIVSLFDSRLQTLTRLIDRATEHFGDNGFLTLRLVDDMLPLEKQIVFSCDQPRSFSQWVRGEEVSNHDVELTSADAARDLVTATRDALAAIDRDGTELPARRRLALGPSHYADLSGDEYVNDFLVPNFYFHLVTGYDILRANGVAIGKADYMAHLLDKVREAAPA